MSREALRPWNLNVNYLPPPLILSSPPSSPKNVKKQSTKRRIMDDHSGPKCISSRPPPLPTVVQHWPVIIHDVSSPTTEAPPAMLNLDDNYSSSDKAYIEPARSIMADYLAKPCKKTQKTKSKFDRSSWASHIQSFTTFCPSPQSMKPIAQLILWAGCNYSNLNLQSFLKWSC
jgi:hypothetical protein